VTISLNPEQKKAVEAIGHPQAIIGGPGTGKLTVLVEKAAWLIEQGHAKPNEVFLVTHNIRTHYLAYERLHARLGSRVNEVVAGTMRDFAYQALEFSGLAKPIADFPTMRRLLRRAMAEVKFPGSVDEAEKILRYFKAQAKKPKAEEAFAGLLTAYKNRLDAANLTDRYDVIREHILNMRGDKAGPIPAKFLLVNNVQDLTHIQFIWMMEHYKNGAELITAGNDDQSIMGPYGGMGGKVYDSLEEIDDIQQYDLAQSYTCSQNVVNAGQKLLEKCRSELVEDVTSLVKPATVNLQNFKAVRQELEWLAKQAPLWRQQYGQTAILVHHDAQAYYVERVLQDARQPHSVYAQSVWHAPGSMMMMDLLSLMAGTATADELKNFLTGIGLLREDVNRVIKGEQNPGQWLLAGHGDDAPSLPPEFHEFYEALHTLAQDMQTRAKTPAEAFEAAAKLVQAKLMPDDQEIALLAVEGLLSLGGNPADMIPLLKKRRAPDANAPLIISTIEEARNLHFDHVVIPFLAKPVWPWTRDTVRGTDEANDRRLLFVAMTRCKGALTLSHSGTRSVFIDDMKAELSLQ
jgi:superfamily I DNA/RNA helicase